MKKYFLAAVCFLFLSSNVYALDLSRVKTWAASEILTAADLNGEFNNILNHSLTNNDIDAAAGIVGSKLDLSAPGIIGATTPAAATYTTLTINSTSIFKDKMSFTQTDNLEYIDSLADGYLDFEATTGLRWRINATEQVNLTDGLLAPTTDDDIDLGSTTKEFKNLWIDGTANIDSLVADTADINAGTMDGVQIGGTMATGELIINDALDDADGLGSQGASGQYLQSAGAEALPVWADQAVTLKSVTAISSGVSSDIVIAPSKLYKVIVAITDTSADDTVALRFNSTTSGYLNTLDSATTYLTIGQVDFANANNKGLSCSFDLDTNVINNNRARVQGTSHYYTTASALTTSVIGGNWIVVATLADFEVLAVAGSTLTGNIYLYEYDLAL